MSVGSSGVSAPGDLGLRLSLGGVLCLLFLPSPPFSQQPVLRCLCLTRYDYGEQEGASQGPQGAVALRSREDACHLMQSTPNGSPYIFLGMCFVDHLGTQGRPESGMLATVNDQR